MNEEIDSTITNAADIENSDGTSSIESEHDDPIGATKLEIQPIDREDIINDIEPPESAYNVNPDNGFMRPLSHREYVYKTRERRRPPRPHDPIFMKEINPIKCNDYGCNHNHYPPPPEPKFKCPMEPPKYNPPYDYNYHNQLHRYDENNNDTLYDPDNVYGCDYEEGHTHLNSYNGYGEQYTRTVYCSDKGSMWHNEQPLHCHHHEHDGYYNPNSPYDNRPMNNNNESFRTAVLFVQQKTVLSVKIKFAYASNEDKEVEVREGNKIEAYYVDTNLFKLQHITGKIVSIVRSLNNDKLYTLVLDCSEHMEYSVIRVPIANLRDIVVLSQE